MFRVALVISAFSSVAAFLNNGKSLRYVSIYAQTVHFNVGLARRQQTSVDVL